MDPTVQRRLIEEVANAVIRHADELTTLDQAIGDGDHGLNMKRGAMAILERLDDLAAMPLPDALKAAGQTLVMKVGGASGPLYGTLLMTLGKELPMCAESGRPGAGAGCGRRGGQEDRPLGCGPEDDARRARAGARGACAWRTRARRSRPTAQRGGRRRDGTDEGHQGSRVVPRRTLDRPYGSRCAIVDR